jgi:single-strand DNA-binding protein
MANEPIVTIVGNLTADPDLRYLQSGQAVASFTVASTPRFKNSQSGQWEDGEAMFVRCSAWREYAENVAESLSKGMRVIAQGRLTVRSFNDAQGQARQSIEMQVDEIGPSLRYARARVARVAANAPQASQDRFSGPQSGSSYTREVGNENPSERNPWTQGGAPF